MGLDSHSGVLREREVLEEQGFEPEVVELERTARSAAEAADALGVRVAQIVKSLVLRGRETGRPVLVLAGGTNRVDVMLKGIADALRADGVYLMQDIAGSSYVHNNMDHPLGPFLYTISTNHCMTVSLAQDGAGLGTMWGEERAVEMLKEAGFGEVEVKQLPHDFVNSYYIAKKA